MLYAILPLCPLTLVFCTIQHSTTAEVIAQAQPITMEEISKNKNVIKTIKVYQKSQVAS